MSDLLMMHLGRLKEQVVFPSFLSAQHRWALALGQLVLSDDASLEKKSFFHKLLDC